MVPIQTFRAQEIVEDLEPARNNPAKSPRIEMGSRWEQKRDMKGRESLLG
jgi:hypothetical protein